MNNIRWLNKKKKECRPKCIGTRKIGTRELLKKMNENVKFYFPTEDGLRYLGEGEFRGNHVIKIKLDSGVSKRKEIFTFLGESIVPSVIGVGEGIVGVDNYENPVKRNNIYECIMGPIEYLDRDNCSDIKDDNIYIEFIPKSFKKIHVLVNRIHVPIKFIGVKDFDGVDKDGDWFPNLNSKKFQDIIKCHDLWKYDKIEHCKHSDLHDNNLHDNNNKSDF